MATPHNRSTDRSHGQETVATDLDRLAYAGTWSPDWWSRLMAVGSMLVAAAALYCARYPDNVAPYDAANIGSGATVTTVFKPETPADAPADVAELGNEVADGTSKADSPKADSTAGDTAAKKSPLAENVTGLDHAIASAEKSSGKETRTLRAIGDRELMEEPPATDASALEAFVEDASDAAADSAPALAGDLIELDGHTELRNKLVVVNVESQPLKSEFAVTMTIRNTSDQLAVVSDVLFEPNAIIENVSTEFAKRKFGSSSPGEFVVAFTADDNQAEDSEDQGDYEKKLDKTYVIPGESSIDIRLAIENSDHIGYGLVGRLTLEYNVTESLEVENTAIAFIVDQDE